MTTITDLAFVLKEANDGEIGLSTCQHLVSAFFGFKTYASMAAACKEGSFRTDLENLKSAKVFPEILKDRVAKLKIKVPAENLFLMLSSISESLLPDTVLEVCNDTASRD